MGQQEYDINKQTIDEAVRKALDVNSKSGIMFILRERTFREVVEAITPIIVEPFVRRIKELEDQLDSRGIPVPPPAQTAQTEHGRRRPHQSAPPKGLDKLKETLEDMVDLTKQ